MGCNKRANASVRVVKRGRGGEGAEGELIDGQGMGKGMGCAICLFGKAAYNSIG